MRFPSPVAFRWLPAALIVLLAVGLAGERARAAGRKKRDPSIAVRFHAQTTTTDPTFAAKVTAGDPPRELYVEKIPSISERDIASFYPYQATDGTFSATFQLDPHGRATLESMSLEKRGMFIVAAVNGRPVTLLSVDKPITDGVIFIPRGLTLADIHHLGESFDITGKDYSNKRTKADRKEENATTDAGLPKPVL